MRSAEESGARRPSAFVLNPQQPWFYALHHPACEATGSFGCYFDAWGNCSLREAAGPGVFNVPETIVDHFALVPPRFRNRGVFWWRLAQLRLLLGLHSLGGAVPGGLNARTRQSLALDEVGPPAGLQLRAHRFVRRFVRAAGRAPPGR